MAVKYRIKEEPDGSFNVYDVSDRGGLQLKAGPFQSQEDAEALVKRVTTLPRQWDYDENGNRV